jgi:hypothetical protein
VLARLKAAHCRQGGAPVARSAGAVPGKKISRLRSAEIQTTLRNRCHTALALSGEEQK